MYINEQLIEKIKGDTGFVNDILYEISKKNSSAIDSFSNCKLEEQKLSGKLLLIGRSYSASFERRNIGKLPEHGDGTGKFYDEVAKYLIDHGYEEGLMKDYENCEKNGYKFDKKDDDIELLKESVNLVFKFNKLLHEAFCSFDRGKVKKYKNLFSSCSKYMHFHFPKSVFIIDSFSSSKAKKICENDKDVKKLIKDLNSSIEKDAKPYLKHCVRCYYIGCKIKQYLSKDDNIAYDSYPRLIDTYLLEYKFRK